jgi:hypothetical protein
MELEQVGCGRDAQGTDCFQGALSGAKLGSAPLMREAITPPTLTEGITVNVIQQDVSFQHHNAHYSATVSISDTCPVCHYAINTSVLQTFITLAKDFTTATRLQILFRCPRPQCDRLYLGVYEGPQKIAQGTKTSWHNVKFVPSEIQARVFEDAINSLSPQFVKIYTQSEVAESHGLNMICGAGYRRSLEFLLKDFLKSIHKGKSKIDDIECKQIGTLIQEFMTDPRLKTAASRAAWLGNDETHYVRKWESKDLSDLKKLIDLTVHWIETDVLTREFEAAMPDPSATSKAGTAGE